MDLLDSISKKVLAVMSSSFPDVMFVSEDVIIGTNKTSNKGDYTLLIFPLAKKANRSPKELGEAILSYFLSYFENVKFELLGGFLNIEMPQSYWFGILNEMSAVDLKHLFPTSDKVVIVEYSSPNTNKPLHLGHVRNILLGWSISQIQKKLGKKIIKTQVVNDRGIAICKSMLAWQLFGNNETPSSTNIKGDHFVGNYYVLFETKFKEEYIAFQQTEQAQSLFQEKAKEGIAKEDFFIEYKNQYFNNESILGKQAREMLLKWEADDAQVRALWSKMNDWVMEGFNETYLKLGVNFDKVYFESEVYSSGKDLIMANLSDNMFYQKPDSSVWINLENAGLDEKLVLRSDGTSVYITQDIGMADLRYKEFAFDECVYVVANEQDYHFKVLIEIFKAMHKPYADKLHHLSYGMVELPSGRMKSREGTVVDADDLIEEVIAEATNNSIERNELSDISVEEQHEINRIIGLGALKYHLVKVNAKKKMIFDPKESVDLHGNTGPYIQNAYVRIMSIKRKLANVVADELKSYSDINQEEKNLLLQLTEYKSVIIQAANQYDPSVIANYAYALAKGFHKFYHDHSILRAETDAAANFRLSLSSLVAETIKDAMSLLGIEMPEKM